MDRVTNRRFWDDIDYGRPPKVVKLAFFRSSLELSMHCAKLSKSTDIKKGLCKNSSCINIYFPYSKNTENDFVFFPWSLHATPKTWAIHTPLAAFSWHYYLRPRPRPLPRPRPRRPPRPRPRLVGEPPEAVWLGILGANIPGTRPHFTLKGVMVLKSKGRKIGLFLRSSSALIVL